MTSSSLIIFLFVGLFIILFIIYNKNGLFNNNHNGNNSNNSNNSNNGNNNVIETDIDMEIDNKTEMLELMNKAKEKFTALTQDEANTYFNNLNNLNNWMDSSNNSIMKKIDELVKNANSQRINKKNNLVDILTNMYSMAYLDFINNQNSEAYKVYAKYSNPKNNKYLAQYFN